MSHCSDPRMKARYLPSQSLASESSSSGKPPAVQTLPVLCVSSPEGEVWQILPPRAPAGVRYRPDDIRRLQASRHADTPPAAPDEQSAAATEKAPLAREFDPGALVPGEGVPSYTSTTAAEVTSLRDTVAVPMDEFAQTRAPEDLFDDEFTPISGSAPQPAPPTNFRGRGEHNRGRGERGGRGRGRGRNEVPAQVTSPEEGGESAEIAKDGGREPAVRGDRSGTGGVKKPKLSEDELSARMEAVKLNNAKREAAHARAEADEASFQQREQIAQSKRLEERQNRRVMDGERERNRLRKLKAVEGREWDAEKKEEDFAGRGGNASQFRRGAHGGVAYDGGHNGRLYDNGDGGHGRGEFDGPRDGFAPRGPRGRGGRGRGRGRGRGEYDNQTPRGSDFRSQTAPTDNDFPALVGGGKGEQASTSTANWGGKVEQAATVTANANWGTTQATEPFQSPTREEGSWADQVESTVPAAPPAGW